MSSPMVVPKIALIATAGASCATSERRNLACVAKIAASTPAADTMSYATTAANAANHDNGQACATASDVQSLIDSMARKTLTATPISTANNGRLNATTTGRVRRMTKLAPAPARRAASSGSGATKNKPTTTGASDNDMENACRRNSKCSAVVSVMPTARARASACSQSSADPVPVSPREAQIAAAI